MTKNHKDIIDKFSTVRSKTQIKTPNQELMHNIIDSIRPLPPVVDEQYLKRLLEVSNFLGITDDILFEEICAPEPFIAIKEFTINIPKIYRFTIDIKLRINKFIEKLERLNNAETQKEVTVDLPDSSFDLKPKVFKPILAIVNEIKEQVPPTRLSDTAGALHDSQIAQSYQEQEKQQQSPSVNYSRPRATEEEINSTIQSLKNGSSLMKNVATKKIRNDFSKFGSNLISSDMAFAVAGAKQDATSIISYTANQEFIKRQREQDSKEASSFQELKPKILFTSDYVMNGKIKGNIICWKKVSKASGYLLKRINILSGKEISFTIFNEELNERFETIKQYVFSYLAPYYEMDNGNLLGFLDETVHQNAFFYYKISAFQTFVYSKTAIFIAPVNKILKLTTSQLNELNLTDDIDIYSKLAKFYLSDENLDWLLAGINVRASIERRDNRSISRGFGYLELTKSFILEQMAVGKFVIPADYKTIEQIIKTQITTYGIVQVIKDLLLDSGLLYTFEGTDPSVDGDFNKPQLPLNEDKFLGVLASAIDGETFVLDSKTLHTNLNKFLNSGISSDKNFSGNTTIISKVLKDFNLNITTKPVNYDFIDLHTIDGISKMFNLIKNIVEARIHVDQ